MSEKCVCIETAAEESCPMHPVRFCRGCGAIAAADEICSEDCEMQELPEWVYSKLYELRTELAALRAKLADSERWNVEFRARLERAEQQRDENMAALNCTVDRLRTLEERARAVLAYEEHAAYGTGIPGQEQLRATFRRLADVLGNTAMPDTPLQSAARAVLPLLYVRPDKYTSMCRGCNYVYTSMPDDDDVFPHHPDCPVARLERETEK